MNLEDPKMKKLFVMLFGLLLLGGSLQADENAARNTAKLLAERTFTVRAIHIAGRYQVTMAHLALAAPGERIVVSFRHDHSAFSQILALAPGDTVSFRFVEGGLHSGSNFPANYLTPVLQGVQRIGIDAFREYVN